jgi:hypothetical protein
MRDRNFLAEFLARQPQQPQQSFEQSTQIVDDENRQLISALQSQPTRVQGTVPLPELANREALARNLLQQANDRNAHPLARGIAAYFGSKELQNIGAEKGRTQEAIAAAEAKAERLKIEEERAFETGLLEREQKFQAEQADLERAERRKERAFDRQRQSTLDEINARERQRKAEIDERRLQLEEQKAQGVISDKEKKAETAKLEEEAAIVAAEAEAENTIQLIDDLLEHPGFNAAVGFGLQKLPFTDTGDIDKPGGGFIAGTDAASFAERLKQLKGGAFLTARERLRGQGNITDTESNRAEAAQTRMSLSLSEDEFTKAAREYQDIIRTGLERQKSIAKKKGITQEEPDLSTMSDDELRAIAEGG